MKKSNCLRMKSTVLAFLLSFFAMTAYAGNYDYLIVESTDGSTKAFVSSGLSISYSQESGASGVTISVTPSGGSATTFVAADTKSMFFSSDATGLKRLNAVIGNSSIEVYNANGHSVGKFHSVSEAVEKLPKGIFVVKGNQKTIKLIRQ